MTVVNRGRIFFIGALAFAMPLSGCNHHPGQNQAAGSAAELEHPRPKYGPSAKRLYLSHDYFRTHAAPDFWALVGYYQAQEKGNWCSVASFSMVMNALRARLPLTANDDLVTQSGILAQVDDAVWNRAMGTGHALAALPSLTGYKELGLSDLGPILEHALKAYGFKKFHVEIVHADHSPAILNKLRSTLRENEKSDRDFVIANFKQSVFTGDPEGGGHIAPIAAYDAKNHQALVMDPDRQYYEPYWVSEQTLLNGMATHDSTTGVNRGWAWVRVED